MTESQIKTACIELCRLRGEDPLKETQNPILLAGGLERRMLLWETYKKYVKLTFETMKAIEHALK